MKYAARFLKMIILPLAILINFGCAKKAEELASIIDDGSGGTTSKTLLSEWSVSNDAWAIRLDLGGANYTGSSFTMTGSRELAVGN